MASVELCITMLCGNPKATTYLVTAPKCRNDTIGTETMQTLLRGHGLFKHIQANRTHELAVQAARADRDLGVVSDRILGRSMELVKRQFPSFVQADLLRGSHLLPHASRQLKTLCNKTDLGARLQSSRGASKNPWPRVQPVTRITRH